MSSEQLDQSTGVSTDPRGIAHVFHRCLCYHLFFDFVNQR